jgi:hypothetical protein
MKRKENKREAKISKRKRIKWNSGTICKEMKKNIKVGLIDFQVNTWWSEKKQNNVSEKMLFRFASKQTKKSEAKKWMKNFFKRNKAKIRCINFALVGSEKFFFPHERAKRVSFRFEANNFFCETGAPFYDPAMIKRSIYCGKERGGGRGFFSILFEAPWSMTWPLCHVMPRFPASGTLQWVQHTVQCTVGCSIFLPFEKNKEYWGQCRCKI